MHGDFAALELMISVKQTASIAHLTEGRFGTKTPRSCQLLMPNVVPRTRAYRPIRRRTAGFMLASAFAILVFGSARGQGADIDQFGIQKIYADAPPPINNWVFSGDPKDPRFMEQRVVASRDGWFRPEDPAEMRVEVLSDPAANDRTIDTFDVARVLSKGYLFKPPGSPDGRGDFLNIEQTWRIRVIKAGTGLRNGGAHIELVPGGYLQTSQKGPAGRDRRVPASCETMSYHFNVYPATGRVKMEKDSDHTSGYALDDRDPSRSHAVPRFDDGREVIQKAVLYRTAAGMKLEMYLDMTGRGDHFDKVLEYEDNGQWGPTIGGNGECDCSENVVLSMARVAIGYRCDNMIDFEFKDMSIRSIDPKRMLHAQ
jgi:hypothetical protein